MFQKYFVSGLALFGLLLCTAAVALAGQDGDAADALRSMLPHTALFPVSSSGLSAAQEAAALLGATHRKGE